MSVTVRIVDSIKFNDVTGQPYAYMPGSEVDLPPDMAIDVIKAGAAEPVFPAPESCPYCASIALNKGPLGVITCCHCHKVLGLDEITAKAEAVDHPKHYNTGKYEVIEVIEDWGLDKDFLLGNVIKYVGRAGHKGPKVEDLKKAAWYLARAIKNLEAAQ